MGQVATAVERKSITERDRVRQEVGRMLLLGYGAAGTAAALDLDTITVERLRREVQAEWVATIENPTKARADMLGWIDWLKRRTMEWMQEKPSPAWVKAMDTTLMAELEITGLRRHTVNVESETLVKLFGSLAQARGAPALASGDVVDGEVHELGPGDTAGGNDGEED